jgi:hypothetical protein
MAAYWTSAHVENTRKTRRKTEAECKKGPPSVASKPLEMNTPNSNRRRPEPNFAKEPSAIWDEPPHA